MILRISKIIFNFMLLAMLMVWPYSEFIVYGAENEGAGPVKSYKFHMLKDKISSLNESNNGSDSVLILSNDINKPIKTLAAGATTENIIINEVNGVKVIKNNPDKEINDAVTAKKKKSGKPAIFIEDRLRWENNNYRMNGGNNFNNSTFINRTRLNVKYDLNENVSANFYSDEN